MKSLKILIIIVFLLIGSVPLISVHGSVEVDIWPDTRASEAIDDDLGFSGPFSLSSWLYNGDWIVRHSNGDIYYFDGRNYEIDDTNNEYEMFLIVSTIDHEGNEIRDEYYDLPPLSRDLGYIQSVREYFFEADNGDIYGLICVQTGPSYGSNYLDPDQYIMVYLENEGDGNFDIDSWLLGEVQDINENVMGLFNIGEDHFLSVHYNSSWHLIPYDQDNTLNDTYDIEDNGPYGISFDILEVGNELCLVRQTGLGEINLSFLGSDLNVTRSFTFDAYPGGVGQDNIIHSILVGDDIHLFIYRDLILQDYRYVFKYLDHFRVSSSGSLIASNRELPIGGGSFLYDIEPILFEEEFLIVEGTTTTVYRFDLEMSLVQAHTLTGDPWNLMWPVSVEIIEFQNQSLIVGSSYETNVAWGINIQRSDELPLFGSLSFKKNSIINDITEGLWVQIHIADGAEVLFEDVMIRQVDTFSDQHYSIQNYGTLIFENVTYKGDRFIEIYNYGTMTMENVDLKAEFYGNGNLTFIGSNNKISDIFDYDFGDYENSGKITFIDIYQTSPGSIDTDMNEIIKFLKYEGGLNIIVRDGYFFSQSDILGNSVGSATFVNCEFEKIGTWGGSSDLAFYDCDFYEVDSIQLADGSTALFMNSSFRSCSETLQGSPGSLDIINCSFEETDSLTGHLDPEFMNVTDSEFLSSTKIFHCAEVRSFHIQDSTFERCTDIFLMFGTTYFMMHDNNLINCNRTIGIDRWSMEPSLFEVYDNKFVGGKIIAFLDEDPLYRVSLFDYDDPDEVLTDDRIQFFDISDNFWDTDDPGVVASRLTFGFKFLPFRSLNGIVISTDDNDIDGMDDQWELKHGLDPNYYFDRFMDGDMDGYSNYEEFKTDCDPFDVDSAPDSDIMKKRVIPWVITASVIMALLFIIFFPVNSMIRGIRFYRDSKFQKYWAPKHQNDNKRNRRRPMTLRPPMNEEVRHR